MLDLIGPTTDMLLGYCQKLVADIPEDQMCAQPVSGRTMNHAAFLLGHLAWANDSALNLLGRKNVFDPSWKELYGMGETPLADRGRYPAKQVLVEALAASHARLKEAVAAAPANLFDAPSPERLRGRFPTVRILILVLMTSHFAGHLGQLSAWRRANGWPSVT